VRARGWARREEPQRDLDVAFWVARAGAGTHLLAGRSARRPEARSALVQRVAGQPVVALPARLAVAPLGKLAAGQALGRALRLPEAVVLPAAEVQARRPFARERPKTKTPPKARACTTRGRRATRKKATEACPSN